MNILVFDIETVPDIKNGSLLYDLHGLSEEDSAKALFALRRAKTGHEFLPHYLQKIVAISLVFYQDPQVKVWSLGSEEAEEKELIARFFAGIEQFKPCLVSWNGSGFDLPVLHYRALFHGVQAPCYWETGDKDQQFRWNNYLNRFHYRHLDLMDVLAAYQNKAFAPLDEIASICGFPGKMGMDGSKVWDAFRTGKIQEIRNYCETDVLNTFCVYLRFECMRGVLSKEKYEEILDQLKTYLNESQKPHLETFSERMRTEAF